jgi:hypothetical protein
MSWRVITATKSAVPRKKSMRCSTEPFPLYAKISMYATPYGEAMNIFLFSRSKRYVVVGFKDNFNAG